MCSNKHCGGTRQEKGVPERGVQHERGPRDISCVSLLPGYNLSTCPSRKMRVRSQGAGAELWAIPRHLARRVVEKNVKFMDFGTNRLIANPASAIFYLWHVGRVT